MRNVIMTTKEFIRLGNIIHNYKYDYCKVICTTSRENVIIICPIHKKEFNKTPYSHINLKKGCWNCSSESINRKRMLTTKQFVEKSRKIHGGKYDYKNSVYTGGNKIEVICKTHGSFFPIAYDHWSGHHCYQCGNDEIARKLFLGKDEFIRRAVKVHENKYYYDESIYVRYFNYMEIRCNLHGYFWQKPSIHLAGHGCQACALNGVSKPEIEWLDSLGIIDRQRRENINGKIYKFDGFDSKTNTVYEYNGDYFHGNPKVYKPNDINDFLNITYGELYRKTIEKENAIKQAGFNLVVKWETEF